MATTPAERSMHIGELAEHTGLSVRTVRHYDDVGLLHPSGRSEGGFRLYSATDLERLLVIRRMKPLGYSLEQMADVLAVVDRLHAGDEAAGAALTDYLVDVRTRRARLVAQLEMADEFVAILEREGGSAPG